MSEAIVRIEPRTRYFISSHQARELSKLIKKHISGQQPLNVEKKEFHVVIEGPDRSARRAAVLTSNSAARRWHKSQGSGPYFSEDVVEGKDRQAVALVTLRAEIEDLDGRTDATKLMSKIARAKKSNADIFFEAKLITPEEAGAKPFVTVKAPPDVALRFASSLGSSSWLGQMIDKVRITSFMPTDAFASE